MSVSALPMLIFDADCGICMRFAGSALVRRARVTPVGYQSLPVVLDVCSTAMVLVAGEHAFVGARAFNQILRRCGGWRAIAGSALSLPILHTIETCVYRVIAANRRSISGRLGLSVCTPYQQSPNSSGGSLS